MVVDSDGLSVASWFASWLLGIRQTNRLTPRSIENYETYSRRYVVPALGHFKLAELTSLDVQTWLDGLIADGLGVPTVKHIRATLRVALGRALKMQLVSRNVCGDAVIELPTHSPAPAQMLELGEIECFQAAIFSQLAGENGHFAQSEATLLYFGLTTGLRNEEVIGLDWSDVELVGDDDASLVHVRRILQRVPDYAAEPKAHSNGRLIQPRRLHVGTPKSAAGRRTLPLSPETSRMLRAERDRQRLAGWTSLAAGDLVFRTRYGKPMSDVYLNQRMRRMCERAGIPYRSFYALRHTAASLLFHAGESDVSIAQFLGHADPATTKRIYARMFKETLPGRMEKTRQLLLGMLGVEGTAS